MLFRPKEHVPVPAGEMYSRRGPDSSVEVERNDPTGEYTRRGPDSVLLSPVGAGSFVYAFAGIRRAPVACSFLPLAGPLFGIFLLPNASDLET